MRFTDEEKRRRTAPALCLWGFFFVSLVSGLGDFWPVGVLDWDQGDPAVLVSAACGCFAFYPRGVTGSPWTLLPSSESRQCRGSEVTKH